MYKFIVRFKNDDSGAVTVDWVVLTAAVVGLAIAAIGSIQEETSGVGSRTGSFLSTFEPPASP
jgi:Flp pilus assembly pilin Flp